MYKNNQLTAVILARMASNRLRNKMLLPFGESTVIETVIKRIKKSQLIDSFILAISTNPIDDVFEEIAQRTKISFFRGSEEDVVSRMMMAINELQPAAGVIIKVCSDNPFLMPYVIDEAIVRLVDSQADLITPFEFNTYPFGYSMVAMTKDCLKRINEEAREKNYREHVENFCFEFPEKFKILYQKAPEYLYSPELNLTLDYEVDYHRLKQLYSLINNIPLMLQAKELINEVKKRRVGVFIQREEFIGEIVERLRRNCNHSPVIFCLAEKGTSNYKTIKTSNNEKGINIEIIVEANEKILLDKIKKRDFDLLICSDKLPKGFISTSLDNTVIVDKLKVDGNERYCLRYDTHNNGVQTYEYEESLFLDIKSNVQSESHDEFLTRVFPLTIKYLIAGPLRPANKLTHFYPPKEKQGTGKRKNFPNPLAVSFPPVILVELIDKVNYRGKSNVVLLDEILLDKFVDEIDKYCSEHIILGIFNDPHGHPEFKNLFRRLSSLLEKEKILVWPEGTIFRNMSLEKSIFYQIILNAKGYLKYSVRKSKDSTIIDDFSKMSIAEAWQSKKIQLARVDTLNLSDFL